MEQFKIGQLAKLVEMKIETIRYYEDSGLLGIVERDASGYRIYTMSDVYRIGFIKKCKEFGFKLNEIKELIQYGTVDAIMANYTGGTSFKPEELDHIMEIVLDKVNAINKEIEELSNKKASLMSYFETITTGTDYEKTFCPNQNAKNNLTL